MFALYGVSMHTITGTLKTISFVPNGGNWAEDERKWQEKAGKACENEKFVVILRSLLQCAVFALCKGDRCNIVWIEAHSGRRRARL